MDREDATKTPPLNRSRQDRQMAELLRISKDTNKLLRGTRRMRRVRVVVIVLILSLLAGYGYYLFEKHRVRIAQTLEIVEELHARLDDLFEAGEQFVESADSVRTIFASLDSEEVLEITSDDTPVSAE